MKLLDVFTTEQDAITYLNEQFTNCPLMLGKIKRMSCKQLMVLGCMVKGYTVSNEGNGVADVEDVALLSRVHDFNSTELGTKFYLPVDKVRTETVNDQGQEVVRVIGMMQLAHIEALKSPELARSVCRQYQTIAHQSKSRSDNRKFDKLHSEFDNTAKLTARFLNRKLKLNPKDKAQLTKRLEDLLNDYSQQ